MTRSFASSVSRDYKVTDATETITFTPMNRAPPVSAFSITYADPHDYTMQEIGDSNGTLQVGDRQWALGADQFATGVRPQRGDKITRTSGEVDIIFANPTLDAFGISWICQTGKAR